MYGISSEVRDLLNTLNEVDANVDKALEMYSLMDRKEEDLMVESDGKERPYLYKKETGIPLIHSYTIKRTFKGLVSFSLPIKKNYSSFLYGILSMEQPAISVSTLLTWADTIFSISFSFGDGNPSMREKTLLFAGKLIFYEAIIRIFKLEPSQVKYIFEDMIKIGSMCEKLLFWLQDMIVSAPFQHILKEFEKDSVAKEDSVAFQFICRWLSIVQRDSECTDPKAPKKSTMQLATHYRCSLLNCLKKADLGSYEKIWRISSETINDQSIRSSFLSKIIADIITFTPKFHSEESVEPFIRIIAESRNYFAGYLSCLSNLLLCSVIITPQIICHFFSLSMPTSTLVEFSQSVDSLTVADAISTLSAKEMTLSDKVSLAQYISKYSKICRDSRAMRKLMECTLKLLLETGTESVLQVAHSILFQVCHSIENAEIDYDTNVINWIKDINSCLNDLLIKGHEGVKKYYDSCDLPIQEAFNYLKKSKRLLEQRDSVEVAHLSPLVYLSEVLLHLHPSTVCGYSGDLYEALKSLLSSKRKSKDLDPRTVILEILVQLVSEDSSFIRVTSTAIFGRLVPYLDKENLDPIIEVLKSSLASQDVLDEEDDEEEDNVGDDIGPLKLDEMDISKLVSNNTNVDDAMEEEEEEDIPLDQAGSKELADLDQHLQNIFKEMNQTKGMKSRKTSSVLKLKLKLAAWMSILMEKMECGVKKDQIKSSILLSSFEFIQSAENINLKKNLVNTAQECGQKLEKLCVAICAEPFTSPPEDLKEFTSSFFTVTVTVLKGKSSLKKTGFNIIRTLLKQANLTEMVLLELKNLWIDFVKETKLHNDDKYLAFFGTICQNQTEDLGSIFMTSECIQMFPKYRHYKRVSILKFITKFIGTTMRTNLDFCSLLLNLIDELSPTWQSLKFKQLKDEFIALNDLVLRYKKAHGDVEAISAIQERLGSVLDNITSLDANQKNSLKVRTASAKTKVSKN